MIKRTFTVSFYFHDPDKWLIFPGNNLVHKKR